MIISMTACCDEFYWIVKNNMTVSVPICKIEWKYILFDSFIFYLLCLKKGSSFLKENNEECTIILSVKKRFIDLNFTPETKYALFIVFSFPIKVKLWLNFDFKKNTLALKCIFSVKCVNHGIKFSLNILTR
jgi:hypothetical protein